MTTLRSMAPALAALALVGLLAGSAHSAPLTIEAGFDAFLSEPGTFFTLPALPSGFFGSKAGTPSDPTSEQVVDGVGNPPLVIPTPWTFQTQFVPDPTCHVSGDLAHSDCVRIPVTVNPFEVSTVVERFETAFLTNIGDSDTVGLRMRELHLVSIVPIEITYGSEPSSFFDVFVDIFDPDPASQPPGTLSFLRTGETSGTMVTTLPVCFTVSFQGTSPGDPTASTTPEQCIVLGGPESEPSTWQVRVPEPSSLFLLGSGLAGAFGWTWLRARRQVRGLRKNVRVPSRLVKALLFAVALFAAVPPAVTEAVNVPIPTHGAVTHFDLNPGAAIDVIPAFPGIPAVPAPVVGGPCFSFVTGEACGFVDGLPSLSLWHWETEITNINPVPVVFNVGFFFPNGGGPLIGRLGLGVGSTFHIDIHVQDFPPEVGGWGWFAFSGLPFALGIDTSVTENFTLGPEFPGQFSFAFHTNGDDFFNVDRTLTPDLRTGLSVPEPSTTLLLLAGCAVAFRRLRPSAFRLSRPRRPSAGTAAT